MSMNVKVSIIIPTYKRSGFLERAIESVLNQTYTNIEVIVVDDNDPNSKYRIDTVKTIERYSNDSRVKYIKNKKNLGGALARNEGIYQATGGFITFLDDDDEYLPNKVENQVIFMIDNNCDMSFTDLKLVNENRIVVDYREYSRLKKFDKTSLLKYHIMRHLTGTPTFMYTAESLRAIGGFEDAKVGQEFYLMLKSIESDLKICYLNNCDVIAYRHRDGGISYGRSKIKGENILYDFKKKYFHMFTRREKMFIRFRHYAVMTIAYKRNNHYFKALFTAIIMILVSPVDFIIEFAKLIINILKNLRLEN